MKNEFIDQIVNYFWLAWMLRPYRTYNPTVGFSKYEFNNKLLSSVTLFRVIPSITWIQPLYIYIYIYRHTHWEFK